MHTVLDSLSALGGVASCDELREFDHGLRDIDRVVRLGDAQRVRRGWVALADAPVEVVAAVRAGGTLGCVSALRRHDVWAGSDGRRHVRVQRFAHLPPEGVVGYVFHRSLPLTGVAPARGGIDSIGLSLACAATCQQRYDAVAAIDSALHQRRLSRATLERIFAQLPACRAEILGQVDDRAESGIETYVRLGLRAVNIRCRPQVAISGVGRVDLLIGERLIIEVDGHRWHSRTDDVRSDKSRDLAAAERGYLVLRLTYEQVMFEWPRVVAVIRGIVARGEHRWAARHRRGGLVAL